jgi:sialate O-acetylesterase
MIAPLVSYKIKGAIWYQGETNARDAIVYRKLFPAMIQDWRRAWNEGDFPFLYVQLANFKDMPTTQSFPLVREAQLMTLSLPNTAMAVAIDIGNPQNIHPRNKQEVGRRLGLGAMAVAYGQKIEYSGPLYTSMTVEGSKIRLHFSHVDGGLAFNGGPWLKGFEIAGADHRFVSGAGSIDGDTVLVGSVGNTVSAPVAVRYDWENSPDGNLCNETGLPASPFRTDDWPLGPETDQK